MRRCSFLILACTFVVLNSTGLAEDPKPSLETAYREWHKGFSSKDKEEQLKTLRKTFPTKEDIAYLFPKHVDKLWPNFEKTNKLYEDNVDKVAAEVTRGGEIKNVKPTDIRLDKERVSGSYKKLLEMIPKDVGVYRLAVDKKDSASGSSTYLYVKDHWIFIRDADVIPEFLEKP